MLHVLFNAWLLLACGSCGVALGRRIGKSVAAPYIGTCLGIFLACGIMFWTEHWFDIECSQSGNQSSNVLLCGY